MTDTPAADEGEAFAVVPSAEYVLALERRIAELERPVDRPALGDEAKMLGVLELHDARLGRHRAELERLKTGLNDLLEYVKQNTPAVVPANEGSPL